MRRAPNQRHYLALVHKRVTEAAQRGDFKRSRAILAYAPIKYRAVYALCWYVGVCAVLIERGQMRRREACH